MKTPALLFLFVAVLSILFGTQMYPCTNFCTSQINLSVKKLLYFGNTCFQDSGIFNDPPVLIPKRPGDLSGLVLNSPQNTITSNFNCTHDPTKYTAAVDTLLMLRKSYVIDGADSVLFNFSNATINGIYVEFPISINSNDSIYAVDFSLKYNGSNVEFDSIVSLTNGLQYQYYLNPNDSILRFTSNRLSAIPNDSDLVILKFKTFNGQMCAPDIDSVHTYLNGDSCSYQLYGCIISGIVENAENSSEISIFPNPVISDFAYTILGNSTFDAIKILNLNGSYLEFKIYEDLQTINVQNLAAGLYVVEFINKTTGYRKRMKLVKVGNR